MPDNRKRTLMTVNLEGGNGVISDEALAELNRKYEAETDLTMKRTRGEEIAILEIQAAQKKTGQ